MKVKIKDIKIKRRIRREDGDLITLMESIRRHGLINPVTISEKHELLAGHRRLKACRELGYDEVECRVVCAKSKLDRLLVEADENMVRKDFTPGEYQMYEEEKRFIMARGWSKVTLWFQRVRAIILRWLRGWFPRLFKGVSAN